MPRPKSKSAKKAAPKKAAAARTIRETAPERTKPITAYQHSATTRINNSPVGMVTPSTDPDLTASQKTYAYDPHLDPQLQWAGKAEHLSFTVPTQSLHVHERIDPRTMPSAPGPHQKIAIKIIDDRGVESLKIIELDV